MNTILNRIEQISQNEGIKITVLERVIGASKGVLSRAINNNTDIQAKWLQLIVENYPMYSPRWLLTGRGNMLEEAPDQPIQITNLQPAAATVSQQSIPVYDLQMGGQSGTLFDGGLTPVNYISLPNLPQCDGAMVLYGGDTMAPTLETGDILVYKRVKDIRRGLFIGHLYIVTFEMEGEEYLLVRRVEMSNDENCLKLASNRASNDIPFDSIKGMAMVKASVRRYEP